MFGFEGITKKLLFERAKAFFVAGIREESCAGNQ